SVPGDRAARDQQHRAGSDERGSSHGAGSSCPGWAAACPRSDQPRAPPNLSGAGPSGASAATPTSTLFAPTLIVMSCSIGVLLRSLHALSLYLPGASRWNLNRPCSSVTTYDGAATTTM